MENGDFKKQPKGFATKAIHSGQSAEQWNSNCVVPPIIMSTTFKQDAPAEHRGFEYGRSGNPTRNVLESCLAALDSGKFGLTFASGLGAITTLLSVLDTGDHVVLSDDVYGGTGRLIRNLAHRFGIKYTFVDPIDINNIKNAITPNTKLLFVETPTNPLLKVVDIQKVANLAKEYKDRKIIVAVDNTFLSPYFQRPLELGADISLYSLTKYMNGHSDVIMGAMITSCPDLHTRLRFLQNATGIVPSPFDCYQVNRSLKTLALRMQQHSKSSIAVAKYLEKHPFIERVIHPGLPSHPQYDLVRKQTYGHSGIMSFIINGGLEESRKFLKALKIFTLAESLGGYESLAELPSIMTHASVPAEERARLGITDSLIRLSVGLEDVDDLIEDIEHALKPRMNKHAKNALCVAKFLEANASVLSVYYPGLKSHPNYELNRCQCHGTPGNTIFYLNGQLQNTKKFLETLKIFKYITTHSSLSEKTQAAMGTENLICLSIGLEDIQDIVADLDKASQRYA